MRIRLKTGGLFGAVLAVGLALAGSMAPPSTADPVDPSFAAPGFFSTQVTFKFAQPIGMAVAPEGRIFVTDNAGYVWTSTGGGAAATKLFDLSGHVNEVQDRGLISVAVDKDYAFNHYIYLAYTFEDRSEAELEENDSLKELPKTQRLVRVTVPMVIPAEPIVLEPSDEVVVLGGYSSSVSDPGVPFSTSHACPQPSDLVSGDWSTSNESDCIPSDSIEHTIDTVRVDPEDGTLWVSVGDGAEGGSSLDTNSWRSQRNESYSGKLLHIDTDGEGLSGHPFCPSETDLTKVCTKVFAKGFRNPFRFFLRPAPDRRPAVADAGWSTREELDLAESGKNYGWPCREGKIPAPTWNEEAECEALPGGTFTEPVYDYHQIEGGAILGGVSYEGTSESTDYPDRYKGAIFISDYITNQVLYLRLNEAGTAVAPEYPRVFADDLQAVDWAIASNGDLMYVDIGFGPSEFAQIRRVSFDLTNVPPQAVASADKTYGPSPLEVEFDASKSSDANGGELTYSWDFDEDGEPEETSNEPTAEWTFSGAVNKEVTLTVEDELGAQDTDSIEVFPGDEFAPEPSFDSGPMTFEDGEQIAFTGSAEDGDDGLLANAALAWNVKLDHGGTHVHPIVEPTGVGTVKFETDTAHDAPSTYIVQLTAADSRGLKTTIKRVLQPRTRLVRIDSSPAGAPIGYGGVDQTAPYEKQSTIGLVTTLSATRSFLQATSLFEFDDWSDGGQRIHDLVIPDHDLSVTANYHQIEASGDDGSGGGGDTSPARLFFNAKKGVSGKRRAVLHGAARDPSGVRRVDLALRKRRKRKGRCFWWLLRRGGFAKRPGRCSRPRYMRARLSGRGEKVGWKLNLRGRLAPGVYLLYFRTLDRKGNRGAGPRGRRPVRLVVRKSKRRASRHRHHQRANS